MEQPAGSLQTLWQQLNKLLVTMSPGLIFSNVAKLSLSICNTTQQRVQYCINVSRRLPHNEAKRAVQHVQWLQPTCSAPQYGAAVNKSMHTAHCPAGSTSQPAGASGWPSVFLRELSEGTPEGTPCGVHMNRVSLRDLVQ